MEMIDVRRVDQAVHRSVDRRCCTAFAMQAIVEGGDHLVFPLDSWVDIHQPAHSIKTQRREAGLSECAKITAGTLDPDQLNRLARHRVGLAALSRSIASG